MVLQIIGFIALLGIACYATFAALAIPYMTQLFGGRLKGGDLVAALCFCIITIFLWWAVFATFPFQIAVV